MQDKNAVADDPIEDMDVPIRCSHKHQRTDYDRIDGSEFPVVIDSDFDHDPVEGCQGSYTQIAEIEGGCPNCGYDRVNVSHQTLAGVHREVCRACGVDITERNRDDWTPKEPFDPVRALQQDAEYIGKIGHTGGKLYRRGEHESGDLFAILKHGHSMSMYEDEIIDLCLAVLKEMGEGDIDHSTAANLVTAIVKAYESTEDDDD